MPSKDPRVDEYIASVPDFAKPILVHVRKLIHKAHPEISESIKWGFPNFDYKGPLCSMASFKNHCSLNFWKASLMKDSNNLFSLAEKATMGNLGRLTSLKDLPSDKILLEYLKEAIELNEQGIKKAAKPKAGDQKTLVVPEDLHSALKKNEKAKATFDKFPPGQKKEYITWIEEAKTVATREKRLLTAIGWMAEGKIRQWKYQK